jgi:hypothetical protein
MDWLPIFLLVGGVLFTLLAIFLGLLVVAYVVHLISGEHDHEHFDYEDLYPDKSHKHHK